MQELSAQKFKGTAIRDTVAEALRRALLDGRFQPGEDLSDAAIASEFQISRGPVREAMLVLAEEGLLSHTHNRGFSVPNFTARDLEQIEVVRIGLEAVALAAAREHTTKQNLTQLTECKNKMVRCCAAGSIVGRVHAEIEFHAKIWEMSENPWLVASLKRVVIPCLTYGTAFRKIHCPKFQSTEMLDEVHMLYIEFLRGCDDHTPEECVRIHLQNS